MLFSVVDKGQPIREETMLEEGWQCGRVICISNSIVKNIYIFYKSLPLPALWAIYFLFYKPRP